MPRFAALLTSLRDRAYVLIGAKVLIHALLCSPTHKCSRTDCTEEVAQMKQLLLAMEQHASTCASASTDEKKF